MSNPIAIVSELKNNGNGAIADKNTYQKQAPAIAENIALKDARNENIKVLQSSTEKSVVLEERADVDSMKLDGSIRIVPECPPNHLPNISSSSAMPHPPIPIRSHDISFGLAPAPSSVSVPCATPVPVSLIKPANPSTSIESNHRDYIQRLLSMSPKELSKHAVELEKRSMQITRAANREIHRKAALNINLAHPPPSRDRVASHPTK